MATVDGDARLLARVQRLADDGETLYLLLPNGNFLIASLDEGDDEFHVGDVVLVDAQSREIEFADEKLWPVSNRVGTVKIIGDDRTTLSVGGTPIAVPTPVDPTYTVGDTVEFNDTDGILSVLTTKPIQWLDLARDEAVDVSQFRVELDHLELDYDDFGGYEDVLARARDLIEVPLSYRSELAAIGANGIKGVLFFGPPGSGKTLLARIIAKKSGAAFYLINGPEIFSKYVGDSEAVLRGIFDDARENQPAIIFFDEIDSIAAERQDSSHESSRRAVAQLLTLMDGFEPDRNVLVIAATNRRNDIDRALLRPGRFDLQLEFRDPNRADREAILRTAGAAVASSGNLPYGYLADKTEGWSAAELAAIWTEAALVAVKAGHPEIYAEDFILGYEVRSLLYHQAKDAHADRQEVR